MPFYLRKNLLAVEFKTMLFGTLLLALTVLITGWKLTEHRLKFFSASDKRFRYVGRMDFTDRSAPKFWASGTYVEAQFAGTSCEVTIKDEMLYGKSHNYVSIQIDDLPVQRIKLKEKSNLLKVADGLADTRHKIIICKSTESGIGFIQFVGLSVSKLHNAPKAKSRKIEFIGNSITSGTGSDESVFPCGKGEWYDQHNAFQSYGPLTARALNADWQLTSASGIGLMKSCCNMKVVMPDIIDKVSLSTNDIQWDFDRYQPDVITVCLGQNDGILDSVQFCGNYVKFLKRLRGYYPKASMVCISSPMANAKLRSSQERYLSGVVNAMNATENDKNIFKFFFSRGFNAGCGGHPSLAQHQEIADELVKGIKSIKHW